MVLGTSFSRVGPSEGCLAVALNAALAIVSAPFECREKCASSPFGGCRIERRAELDAIDAVDVTLREKNASACRGPVAATGIALQPQRFTRQREAAAGAAIETVRLPLRCSHGSSRTDPPLDALQPHRRSDRPVLSLGWLGYCSSGAR